MEEAGKSPGFWLERAVEAIERGCEVTRLLLKARVLAWRSRSHTIYAAAVATKVGEKKKTVAFTSTPRFIPSSSHYQCDMASLDCQFGHCIGIWMGGSGGSVFLRCCFRCCHTLPPVGARRAWWFSCLPLRGSPRMGGWNGDLKGWRRARNKKIIDIQKKKNLVLWGGLSGMGQSRLTWSLGASV